MQKNSSLFRTGCLTAALVLTGVGFSGCTTTTPTNHEDGSARVNRREINASTDAALAKLYETTPSARDLISRAKGVVVFPAVLQAGLGVGAEYGKGVLRVGSTPEEYYRLTAGSVGWQVGAQSKAIFMLFMTEDSLEKFRHSKGWEAGADATVALATVGANGDIDTNTIKKPVVGFVTTNAGLMAGVSLQGAKISRIAQ